MSKATILLIYENEHFLEVIDQPLKSAGYDVVTAHDKAAIRNALRQPLFPPDLIISDLVRRETLDAIRAYLQRVAISWIVVASISPDERQNLLRDYGVRQVLDISDVPDRLLTAVQTELQPARAITRSAEGLFPPEPPMVPPSVPQVPPSAPPELPIIEKALTVPTEEVRFTAYFPKEVTVETWYTLLVYAHVEAALAKVQADAARFKAEMGDIPKEARSGAPAQLARGTEITILPTCDGVIFNPERVTFKWIEDMHRADFRLQAAKELAGLAGNLTVTIFVGPLIVATIRGGLVFNEASSTILATTAPTQATSAMYRSQQIFVSYSHADEDIVIACRNTYEALGWQVLRDRDTLRSGEDWDTRLLELIDQADLFQLFWSENSAKSAACKKEWDHALDLENRKVKGADFIRPVYWRKDPWIPPPDDLGKLHFIYAPLPGAEKP